MGFFDDQNGGIESPAIGCFAVTAHDSNNFTTETRGLYVGGAGNIAIVMRDGTTATLSSVPAGTFIPIRLKRINSTNTTATNMVGFY